MSPPKTWPYIVKAPNVSIPIYRVKNRGYVEFRVAWTVDQKRRLKSFADFEEAKTFAGKVRGQFQRGETKSLTLTGDDLLIFNRAKEVLKGTGMTLDAAASEFANAVKVLGSLRLRDAVENYAAVHRGVETKTVDAVVNEFLAEKEKPLQPNLKPASDRYLSDLTSRLRRFAKSFHCHINTVRSELVKEFLDSQKVGGRTYVNNARVIATLFNFAKSRKYFPKDVDPLEGIDLEFQDDSDIEIFTPAEMRKFLEHADADLIPYLAIGAFAGLRQAELLRLDWSEVKPQFIEVTKGKAKTRSRRLVPIQPNLQKWLADYRKQSGKVVPFERDMFKPIQDLLARIPGAKWKHNGLRHSFVSYRMQILKNENEVAMEAGNSPAKIYQNYRQLVTDHAAKEWFGIKPVKRENVIQLRAAGG